MTEPLDASFGHGLRSLASALKQSHASLRRAYENGSSVPVIERLGSNSGLTAGEREQLAELLSGMWGLKRGNRGSSIPKAVWRTIANDIKKLKADAKKSGRKRPYADQVIEEYAARRNADPNRIGPPLNDTQIREYLKRSESRK